jgi:hypothetical protein
MMAKSFVHLEGLEASSPATVMAGQAGQVNVNCAIKNEVGR